MQNYCNSENQDLDEQLTGININHKYQWKDQNGISI